VSGPSADHPRDGDAHPLGRGTALSALLDGLVDYAGLFPPAALPMPEAVARHATYVRGTDRALLGRFVVPFARLEECAAAVDALPPTLAPADRAPWRLSVLAGVDDAPSLAAFNARERRRLVVDTVETRADAVAAMTAIAAVLGAYATYVEIPVREDPAPLVEALGAHGLRAKVRTGGVTADAFPSPPEVLRFLVSCVRGGVPFKATAGLHHPLRGEYALTYAADAPRGTMYGFLNIFLAAAFLEAGLAPNQVAPLLEERDASAIVVRPESIGWRTHLLSGDAIARTRARLAGSFGSCSFEEPVQDLTSLRLR
jgi:hypothetical protein